MNQRKHDPCSFPFQWKGYVVTASNGTACLILFRSGLLKWVCKNNTTHAQEITENQTHPKMCQVSRRIDLRITHMLALSDQQDTREF